MVTSVRVSQEEETNDLFRRFIETKDPKSRDRLVILHQSLVRYLAGKFSNRGLELEDLVQVGMIGLINAVDRFDPDRGLKFSTYATPTIVGEIRRHFRDKGWSLKVPRRLRELNFAATKVVDHLIQELKRQPTISEIAKEIGADEVEALEAINLGQYYDTVPLDAKIGPSEKGEGTLTISEFVGENHKELEDIVEYGDLHRAIELLDARDRTVIQNLFFDNKTQASVGSQIKVSQMQVSRIQSRSINVLKNIIDSMNGKTSFAVIGVSEARIAFCLWPHLSYTQGRCIDRKKLSASSGLVQGYINLVIIRLVELGILVRTTDGRYKRGLAIVFFNGRCLSRASNGLKVVKYQFYNLDEVATGLIVFKPKKKKPVVEAPQVCRLDLRSFLATCVIWPDLSKTEPRSINYTRLQKMLRRGNKVSAMAMASKLKKIGVLKNTSHNRWIRGCKNVTVNLYGLGWSVLPLTPNFSIKQREVYDLDILLVQRTELTDTDPELFRKVLSISKSVSSLNKRQTIVAMFLWPMLSKENERSLDFDKLSEEIGLTSRQLLEVVYQLERKGMLIKSIAGQYLRGKSSFNARLNGDDTDDSGMLFSVEIKDGSSYDLNCKKTCLRQREKKDNIVGSVLPSLTAIELDACLIIWTQLVTGDWVVPDYNKLSRILEINYNQAYCIIRRVVNKGLLIKEKDKVQNVKTNFIYRKGKGGLDSQICNIKLVEYRQGYDLNELSRLVGFTA